VATIVYVPGGVPTGIVTVVVKEFAEPELAEPVFVEYVTPLSVKVTDSPVAKFVPATVNDPPGTEHPEVEIAIASGS
jgi:hypothetical protein